MILILPIMQSDNTLFVSGDTPLNVITSLEHAEWFEYLSTIT